MATINLNYLYYSFPNIVNKLLSSVFSYGDCPNFYRSMYSKIGTIFSCYYSPFFFPAAKETS